MQLVRPAVVEIVGPPGAGKTTLSSALGALGDGIRPVSVYLSPSRLPRYVADGLTLLPMCLHQSLKTRGMARNVRLVVRLTGAPRLLEDVVPLGPRVVVLDQGPLFTLMRLAERMPEHARGPGFRSWWGRTVRTWAELLDALILVDAPDPVLLDRIRTRSKDHSLKKRAVGARDALASHRQLQEAMIGELRARGDVPVLHVDTGRRSVDETAAETAIGLERLTMRTNGARGTTSNRSSRRGWEE